MICVIEGGGERCECMQPRRGSKASIHTHHPFTTGQSLVAKWEKEEGETVDKDAYPMWAETLLKDEAALLRYCGKE